MSLRYALLGLLGERPRSGYELTREFDVRMANVWTARHSQIYPELSKLLDAGLIRIEARGPRGRKTYSLTAEGRQELVAWLEDLDIDRAFRSEAFLRAFFLDQLDAEAQRRFLAGELAFHRADLAAYETAAEDLSGAPYERRMPIELGIQFKRAMVAWAEWALGEVSRAERTRRAPRRRA